MSLPSLLHNYLKNILAFCWITTAIIGFNGFFVPHYLLTVSFLGIKAPAFIHMIIAIIVFSLPIYSLYANDNWNKKALLISLIAYIVLIILDAHRLTPYMIIYYASFISFIYLKNNEKWLLNALLLLLSGLYIFSGLHKLNVGFVENIAPAFYFHSLPVPYNPLIGYTMAIIEIALGILLLIKRSRTIAIMLLITMHFIIIWKLSPWKKDWNYIIIPWNIFMIALLVFNYFNREKFKPSIIIQPRLAFVFILLFLWIIPATSFITSIPENLSMKLYSGTYKKGYVVFNIKEKEFTNYYRVNDKDEILLSLLKYSMVERGLAFNPDIINYNKVYNNFNKEFKSVDSLIIE